MKIINICILFFIACGTATGSEDSDNAQAIFPQQLTAYDLLTYCSSSSMTDLGRQRQRYCWGFISGVEETLRVTLKATQPVAHNICVPEGASSRNLAKAYTIYAGRKGANLAQPAAKVTIEALSNAYACEK